MRNQQYCHQTPTGKGEHLFPDHQFWQKKHRGAFIADKRVCVFLRDSFRGTKRKTTFFGVA